MTGNESIDLSLENIYRRWFAYRKGKKANTDLDNFQYNLEHELYILWEELNNNTYKHGGYRKFIVSDNKTREISVAAIRDRVVHRLVYDYLNNLYDRTFIYDAWSCRIGKGLLGAIERAQRFMRKYGNGFVWRGDIRKFFDNVDHEVLYRLLSLKISDQKALNLLRTIIKSFSSKSPEKSNGMPIGNLTSQIFSNIYLNELDRFVKHSLKCKAYLRYGDDFVIFEKDKNVLFKIKGIVTDFIENSLKLQLHPRNNLIVKPLNGLKFLGVILYPSGRTLNRRNRRRIKDKLNVNNASSYWGVITKHGNIKRRREYQWNIMSRI